MKTGSALVLIVTIGLLTTGCDPGGIVSAQFRVTTKDGGEPVAGVCVSTDHPGDFEPSFLEQARTTADGNVTVEESQLLRPWFRTPFNHPWLVRVDDGTTVETIRVEHQVGARGVGEQFAVEVISTAFDRDTLSSTNEGCDG